MAKGVYKYQKVSGWWVYVIKTPNNMYYPGYSGGKSGDKQCYKRFVVNNYRTTSLWSYIEEFGWENLEKIVVKDGLTKNEALHWEDRLISMYTTMDCCINQQRSGNITKQDWYKKEQQKKYRITHRKELSQRYKEYYNSNKDAIRKQKNEATKLYYQQHKEERIEYEKQRNSTLERKIYNRVRDFNRHHPDQIKETPLEAKTKYLQWGYIPDYIKSDDLCGVTDCYVQSNQ